MRLIIDTETTGLINSLYQSELPRIIEYACVDLDSDFELQEYYNPNVPIPIEAQKIHGITDEKVKQHYPFFRNYQSCIDSLRMANEIIGYNLAFDIQMLVCELERNQIPFLIPNVKKVCAMRYCRDVFGKETSLIKAFKEIFGFNPKKSHSALEDCKTLKLLLKELKYK